MKLNVKTLKIVEAESSKRLTKSSDRCWKSPVEIRRYLKTVADLIAFKRISQLTPLNLLKHHKSIYLHFIVFICKRYVVLNSSFQVDSLIKKKAVWS